MPIALSELIDERRVALELRATDRDAALAELVAILAATAEVREPMQFLAQVLAREASGSTMVDHALAFPHARTDLVEKIVLAVGRSAAGVPFGADGTRARLIFLIGVPQKLANEYLRVVGQLARITGERSTREALLAAPTAAEFIAILDAAPSI